ncbi:1-acyl-sn-glycerol-3-phosphate acyltransferase [Chitinophaga horti]|uniref:1-acyl-sn-glycerol-3-phosphate acyltransferase n=1 Tax=Chitinophaga horti TaxID=2920382 RepID=A0ABY6J464_9BACT|nr:lysophospholipid acyltransferase family protein [Chitinophaga horti]UYQ94300.1 1-acyl-sn-glycerol-3-phosphate acyltransferase [Chitinophaga horti]
MNWFRNVLGRIYAVYGLLLFVLTMLIVFPIVLVASRLKDPAGTRLFQQMGRVWMFFYMPLIGCPVKRKGVHYFKKSESYVVVCNHNSMIDVPVTTSAIPGVSKTLAKAEMGKIPLFGIMYRIPGIMVDRKDEQSRKNSVVQMKEALAKGMHVLLYPEGTRNKTDFPIKSFYDGAFALAIDTQKPMIPALLFNTRKILPAAGTSFWAWPHPIEFHFLPPIPTEGLTRQDLPTLKEKVFTLMWKYYCEHS